MENMKLISVRIDPKDLRDLDALVEKSYYHKRSDLIQAAIRLMLAAGSECQVDKVCRFSPRWGDVVDEFKFEYHREHS